MFDANQIIYETVWAALPSCSHQRQREILQALRVKLSFKHPAYRNVEAQLALLDTLDGLQSELPFKAGAAKPTTPN